MMDAIPTPRLARSIAVLRAPRAPRATGRFRRTFAATMVAACALAWTVVDPQRMLAQIAPLSLTLTDAIARGLDTSHRLAELKARQEATAAIVDQRIAADRPEVDVTGAYKRTNHVPEFF